MLIGKRINRKIATVRESIREHLALAGNGAIVFLYHRIENLEYDPQELAVSPEKFREQLKYFKKVYRVLSPQEFLEHLFSSKPFPLNSVMITFDDGYEDNVTKALPILESEGVHALFFISTGYLDGNREFWWDEVEKIVLGKEIVGKVYTPDKISLTLRDRAPLVAELKDDNDRHRFYRTMIKLLKTLRTEDRDNALMQLSQAFQSDRHPRITHCTLGKQQLKELSLSRYATIGAHGVHHIQSSSLPIGEQMKEWADSKKELEQITSKKVTVAAYPFGGINDFNASSKKACRDTHFEAVFANYKGKIRPGSDRFSLPRILVRNWSIQDMESHLPSPE